MPVRKLAAVVATSIAALLAICSIAAAAPTVDGHFPTPEFDGSNAKIAAGPDGNMWMPVNEGEFDVARIAPDGSVTPFKLGPEIENALGIAAGPDGRMWVTATNKVGSFAPANPEGTIDVDTVASITSNSPIVAGPDGQMWAAASNAIVHFSTSAPDKAETFSVLGLQPKDIDVAGSLLVVADSSPRIVTMTTSGVEQDYTIGHFNAGVPPRADRPDQPSKPGAVVRARRRPVRSRPRLRPGLLDTALGCRRRAATEAGRHFHLPRRPAPEILPPPDRRRPE